MLRTTRLFLFLKLVGFVLQEPQLKLKKRSKPLKVCVMSADFWGLKTAGGTATAYHLLAAMLAKSHALEVCYSPACMLTLCYTKTPTCTSNLWIINLFERTLRKGL